MRISDWSSDVCSSDLLLLRSASCLHPRVARARDAPIESAMRPRHPPLPKLPKQWLFSDERAQAGLAELAALLPPGSGVILRHDGLASGPRRRLLRRLVRTARTRGLIVLLAGMPDTAWRWGADGVYLRQRDVGRAPQARRLGLLIMMPVPDAREARPADRKSTRLNSSH